jgi:hypothetical protein
VSVVWFLMECMMISAQDWRKDDITCKGQMVINVTSRHKTVRSPKTITLLKSFESGGPQ